jgi:hypothetical protein
MEYLFRILFFIVFWIFLSTTINFSKIKIYPMLVKLFTLIKIKITLLYRVITIKKSEKYVWKELIKHHKNSPWRFGQFDNYIECNFIIDEVQSLKFIYEVQNTGLTFRSFILVDFDEETTTQVMLLASHFNNLLTFGVVQVNLQQHFVEFSYNRDLLVYSLYPGTINNDTITHFDLTKNIFWAFNELANTGDEPVFIFSEFLKRMENRQ